MRGRGPRTITGGTVVAMQPSKKWPARAAKAIGLATVLAASAVLGLGAPAGAATSVAPVQSGSTYLALGDSVPFGYREAANLPAPNYPDAASFVGYPEDVAADLSLHVRNAACPGETSTSFIDSSAPSNGCERSPSGGPGYRSAFPLHVAYQGSQLHYAIRYLRAHPGVRLVSLMIGANDGFLCQETTADHCASELPAVLAKVAANVTTILQRLRGEAGYSGQIVVVNYYSLDYSSALQNAQSQALNNALDSAAQPFDVEIADGFGAFQQAAAQAGGNSCTAGLLTTLTTGGCGVHPSVAGQQLLAGAVERVVVKA
jgi:lysophospholipase L1-like esterase